MTARRKTTSLSEDQLSTLANLSDDAGRKQFLARRRGIHCTSVVRQLNEAARTTLRIDTRQSVALAEAAVVIARKLRNKDALGQSLRAKANALYVLGENESALAFHEKALGIFRATSNSEEEARTLNASIQPCLLLGEYDRALKAADGARDLLRRLGDERRLAHVEINVGNVYHRQDRFEEALEFYRRAHEMLLPLNDSEGLAVALYNMAVCLISLNDFPRALATYQGARQTFAERGMKLLVGQADYNIAYLYYLRGEYGRAIEMLRAAREKAEADSDAHIEALCYLDLSDIYLELNLSVEAADVAHDGRLRFKTLGMGYEEAKCLTNEAIALGQQNKVLQALDLFKQARAAFLREKNHVWPWLIDLYRALVLFNAGRLFEARRCCEKALEFFQGSMLSGKTVLCRLLLARIELASGNAAAALTNCADAIEQLKSIEVPILYHQAHFLMGKAHMAAGDLPAANGSYQKAREALETLRGSLRKDELKIAFMKNKSEVYECLVDICLRSEEDGARAREAFEYVEMGKSRGLMDLIFQMTQAPSQDASAGQSEMVRRIRDLREELNWYYHRIESEQLRPGQSGTARVEGLQSQALDREKALLRELRELPDSEPHAALLRTSRAVPLEEIQASLPREATLVEYFAVDDRLLAAILTCDGLKIIPLTLLSRVAGLRHMLRSQLAKNSLGADYLKRFERPLFEATQSHLQGLYAELVAPLRPYLAGKHLVFVPHGILHSLPLHALFDGRRYLIDEFSVSYAPSASVFACCQALAQPAGNAALVLGVPDVQAPSIGEEARAVGTVLQAANLFVGDAATEQVLRQHGPSARWIHLATHGSFRQDNPMFSGIRLGGSYLSLVDLYNLRLPAELIALSGCATGLNVITPGDELLGLIRGLLGAGAQCLLLTLWDVHDRSTAEFMERFYERMAQGEEKATALQGAMMQFRDQYPHPYHWAPFFLTGKALSSNA